jgi:hypothetical protein
VIVTVYVLAAVELKVQFGVAGVNVPPAEVAGTTILVQAAVRPTAGKTEVVKVIVPSEPVAAKPLALPAGRL